MLTFFKVERNAALLLLAAGILGLIVANTSAAEFVSAIGDQQLTILGFDLDPRGFVGSPG